MSPASCVVARLLGLLRLGRYHMSSHFWSESLHQRSAAARLDTDGSRVSRTASLHQYIEQTMVVSGCLHEEETSRGVTKNVLKCYARSPAME